MLIELSCNLPCAPERCFAKVLTPRLLRYVSSPLVTFKAIDPPALPDQWSEAKYLVGIRLFGWIPFGRQTIRISLGQRSGEASKFYAELRDNGSSALVSKWDHRITVTSAAGGCRYTDTIEVQAGVMTPLVSAFARMFYRHRQRRWQRLVRQGFDYR